MRNASLTVQGVKLFNIVPKNIRNLTGCSKERFKRQLDIFLRHIPDEPQVPGYTICRRAETNSLLDMTKLVEMELIYHLM
jgi:hypothetical protein